MKNFWLGVVLFSFTSAFAETPLIAPLPKYSCELVRDASGQSCNVIPSCKFDYMSSKCTGTIKALPRFLSEFVKDTNRVFSLETILAKADLDQLSLHYKTLAKFINDHKIKETWVLQHPSIGIPEHEQIFKEIQSKLPKYGIAENQLDQYPSVYFLKDEDKLLKFSKDSGVSPSKLLKAKPEVLRILLNDSSTKKLKLLRLSVEEALKLEHYEILYTTIDELEILLNKVHLTPQQILQKPSFFYYENVDELADCTQKESVPWEWISKVENSTYVIKKCANIKKLSDTLKIPVRDFPLKNVANFASLNPETVEKLKKELGLSSKFILEADAQRDDIDAIKETMAKFHLSAEEAYSVSSFWNSRTLEEVEQFSKEYGVAVKDLLKVSYFHISNPDFLKNYKIIQLPLNVASKEYYLIEGKNPEAYKELLDLWISETKPKDLLRIPYQMGECAKTPEKIEKIKRDWKLYNRFISFNKLFDYVCQGSALEYKTQVLFNVIVLGNLGDIKQLPFVIEAGSMIHSEHGPAFVYAKKLGYDDIANFLKQFQSRIVRVETTEGKKIISQCPLEENEDELFARRESWYDRCNEKEKSNLIYKKEVGHFIEHQNLFWNTTQVKSIPVPNSNRKIVENSLEYYKGSGYIPMAKYIGNHKTSSFPFADINEPLSAEINAANYALLLGPKAKFEMTVYRGQSCKPDWVQSPFRFWSTSASAELARGWTGGSGCVIEVQVPKGFPVFFLNIASMIMEHEHEFLLPAYALDKQGKLVPVHYEILKEDKQRQFLTTEYDGEHDIEFQYHFHVHAFVVKPASNLMVYEGNTSFEEYEKQYKKHVCSADKVDVPGFEYLKRMCIEGL